MEGSFWKKIGGYIPPILNERREKWVHKATFTLFVSQLGFIILFLFIGPSDLIEQNATKSDTTSDNAKAWYSFLLPMLSFLKMWGNIFLDYLEKGSLLLSIMSLGANAAANYFWDARKGKEDTLLFETTKSPFIVFLVLVFAAGITYGIMPKVSSIYFIILQLLMFFILAIGIYKINYEIALKEKLYNEQADKEQELMVENANTKLDNNYRDDASSTFVNSFEIVDKPAFDNSENPSEEAKTGNVSEITSTEETAPYYKDNNNPLMNDLSKISYASDSKFPTTELLNNDEKSQAFVIDSPAAFSDDIKVPKKLDTLKSEIKPDDIPGTTDTQPSFDEDNAKV